MTKLSSYSSFAGLIARSNPFIIDFEARSNDQKDFAYFGKLIITPDSENNVKIEGHAAAKNGETFYIKDNKQLVSLSHEHHLECLPAAEIPPFHAIPAALMHAQSLIKDPAQTLLPQIAACTGDQYLIDYTGLSYIICQTSPEKITVFASAFTAYLTITISPTDAQQLAIPTKALTTEFDNCQQSSYESPESQKNDPWYYLPQKTTARQSQSATGKVPRPCYFVHGAGELGNDPQAAKNYWKVESHAPQCTEFHYNHIDTVNKGWNDEDSQQAVCAFLTEGSDDGVIRNKIVFAHSMGNMLISGALDTNKCTFDDDTASWYMSQGPIMGAKAAAYVEQGCQEDGSAVRIAAALTGSYCTGNVAFPAYQSIVPTFPGIETLHKQASLHVSGVMCGVYAWGLNTVYSPALAAISALAALPEDSDGMVDLDSCYLGRDDFEQSPEANFYKATVNHADGTCRNGNGWFGSDRQPCAWYSNKL